jgi:beta-mannosidase
MPEWLTRLDSSRPYWPTTPFGNENDPNDVSSGNRHSWDIWSRWVDYKKVKYDRSLFVSEFGFQGPANFHTLQKCMPSGDFWPQSRIFEFHNKQDEGPERLLKFLGQHLPVKMETEDFIYLTQLNQGLALQSCLEHWRLQWPETSGSIIWQINDVWPVTSWALIDSDLKTKLSYHFTARAFAQHLIAFKDTDDGIDLVLLNNNPMDFKGRVNVVKFGISDGTLSELCTYKSANMQPKEDEKLVLHRFDSAAVQDCIFIATLFSDKDEIIGRNHFLRGEWKHQSLPRTENEISLELVANEKKIKISTIQASFFVMLQHPGIQFSDNGFILLPGENKIVNIQGNIHTNFSVEEIKVFTLNQYLT